MNSFLTARLLPAVLSAMVFLQGFNAIRLTSFATLGDVFLLLAGIVWLLVSAFQSGRRLIKPGGIFLLSFALFFVAFLSSAFLNDGVEFQRNTEQFVKFSLGLYLMTYLVADATRTEAALRKLLVAFVMGAVLNSLVGLSEITALEIAERLNAPSLTGFGYGARVRGLTLHPNFLGQICAIALPLAWVLAKRGNRLFYFVCSLILFAGTLASGSRAALGVAVVIEFAVVAIFTSRLHKLRLIASLPLLIAAGAATLTIPAVSEALEVAVALQRLIDGFSGNESVGDSNDERMGHLHLALQHIGEYPIAGAGFVWITHAHNIYLQALESAGLLGIAALFLFVLTYVNKVRALLLARPLNRLAVGISLAAFGFLLGGLVTNTIYLRAVILPFAFLWAASNIFRSSNQCSPAEHDLARLHP